MFLFQSSKDKAIRQDVQRNIQICISNSKRYNEAKESLVVHLNSSQSKVIEMIVDNIKSTIKNQDLQPVRKYQAILLLKDLMLTHNKALGKYVVKKILKRLTILAQHKSGGKESQKDEERGRDIFGSVKRDQEQYSIKFFTTLLVALEQWGKNWPKTPDGPQKEFQKEYNQLLLNGIQFPKQKPREASRSPPPKKEEPKRPTTPSIPQNERQTRYSRDREKEKEKQKEKQKEKEKQTALADKRAKKGDSKYATKFKRFYQQLASQLQLLMSMIQLLSAEQIPVVRDIVNEIQKSMQGGNELIVIIDQTGQHKEEESKIGECFDYLEKIKKDLKILSKKPAQSDTFKNKYIKLTKKLMETISSNKSQPPSSKPSTITENITRKDLPIQTPSNSQISAQQSVIKKPQQPKIKNINRYISTQGLQLPSQFNKDNNEFHSNSGQSVHSDRFGSFGGPGVAIPDRNSRGLPKDKLPDKGISSPQINPPASILNNQIPSAISQPKTVSQEKINNVIKPAQPKFDQDPRVSVVQIDFGQFALENQSQKKSEDSVTKKIKNFGQDSFALNNFDQKQARQSQGQVNFFEMIDKRQGEQMQNVKKNGRRNKLSRQEKPEEDFFKEKINSKVDSNLSGFQFSQKNVNNVDSNIRSNLQQRSQKVNEAVVREQRQSVHSKKSFQFELNNERGIREENPFSTGNFANVIPQRDAQLDPFEMASVQTPKELENPFNNESFQKMSKKSIQLRQQSSKRVQSGQNLNPFQSRVPPPLQNPFQPNIVQNPFQNSTHKSNRSNNSKNPFEQMKEFYKPSGNVRAPTERNDNNLIFNASQIRNSLVFSININKQADQSGLNFSQFQDVGENRNSKDDFFRKSLQNNQNNDVLAFSLGNFQNVINSQNKQQKNPIGAQAFIRKSLQKESSFDFFGGKEQFSQNPVDFFAKFQKESSKSKVSVSQSKRIFDSFEKDKPSISKEATKGPNTKLQPNFFQDKTVKSQSESSFNFEQLEKISGIQKVPKKDKPKDPEKSIAKNQQREQFVFDNGSQKSVGWEDFDQPFVNKKSTKRVDNDHDQQQNRFLQVQSKIRQKGHKDQDRPISSNESLDRLTHLESQKGLNQLEVQSKRQNAVIVKKGTQWNPMAKLLKFKQQAGLYILDDNKMTDKRKELQQKREQYEQKIKLFQFAKNKNDEIRRLYLQKMKKMQQVMSMRGQYQQIYKKIKENNEGKEMKVEEINNKIKKIKEIKTKALERERKLFELVKGNNMQQREAPRRTMSSKWQMFNKSLVHNRNQTVIAYQSYSQGF